MRKVRRANESGREGFLMLHRMAVDYIWGYKKAKESGAEREEDESENEKEKRNK